MSDLNKYNYRYEIVKEPILDIRTKDGKLQYAKKVITMIFNSRFQDYEVEKFEIRWFPAKTSGTPTKKQTKRKLSV